MTTEHQVSRTLVKSPPELWAECSDPGSLARHIGEFGEIRITRLEPETSVAWEGEHASGTVRIEPSAWGTRVTLTAQTKLGQTAAEAPAVDGAGEAADDGASGAPADEAGEQEAAEAPVEKGNELPITAVEEESDAKVEETTTEPESDPAVATADAPVRGRFRRLIGRTRRWFKASSVQADAESAVDAEPVIAEAEGMVVVDPEPVAAEDDGTVVVDPEPVAAEAAGTVVVDPEPAPREPAETGEAADPAPAADVSGGVDPDEVLAAALESLGQAHHRPFSRA
jgi:hypothetical protein